MANKVVALLALLAALAVPALAQDEAPPAVTGLSAKMVRLQNGMYAFTVNGKTALPDEAILDCTVSCLKRSLSPNAPENPTDGSSAPITSADAVLTFTSVARGSTVTGP